MPFEAGLLHLNHLLEIVLDLQSLPHCAQKYFESRDRQLWDTWHSVVYVYRCSLTHCIVKGNVANGGRGRSRGSLSQVLHKNRIRTETV